MRDGECKDPFADRKERISWRECEKTERTFFKPINPFSSRKMRRYSGSRKRARRQKNTDAETDFFALKPRKYLPEKYSWKESYD